MMMTFTPAVQGEYFKKRREPFFRCSGRGRQAEVQQHNRRHVDTKGRQRRGTVFGQYYLVIAGQRPLHLGADLFEIVNDE